MADPHLVQELRLRARHRRARPPRRRPPRMLPPDPIEREYVRAIRGLVDRVRAAFRAIVDPQIPGLLAQAAATRPDSARADAWAEAAARVVAALRLRVERERGDAPGKLTEAFAEEIGAWQDEQWQKVLKATVGVELFSHEPWLRDELKGWATENAGLISTLQDNAVADVERWTLAGIRAGQRHEEIAAKIEERLGVAESRAEFIARDQTAKLVGQLNERRQTALGVEEYVWRTAGDDRVRPSHREKEGKTFRWDDPPADTGHPGQDYQCRCVAEPNLKNILAEIPQEEGA